MNQIRRRDDWILRVRAEISDHYGTHRQSFCSFTDIGTVVIRIPFDS